MQRTKKKNLIRPIAPATSADAASAASANTSHLAQNNQIIGRRATKVTPKISPIRTTSLTELIKDKEKKPLIPFDTQTEAANNDFSQADLTKHWTAYTNTLTVKKTHLKNTLINCQPILKENFAFEVTVFNPSQKDEITENSADILDYLRTGLSNTHIQMNIRIVEKDEKEMIYTAPEKYAYLNKKNPNLDKLKDKFNLTLE